MQRELLRLQIQYLGTIWSQQEVGIFWRSHGRIQEVFSANLAANFVDLQLKLLRTLNTSSLPNRKFDSWRRNNRTVINLMCSIVMFCKMKFNLIFVIFVFRQLLTIHHEM